VNIDGARKCRRVGIERDWKKISIAWRRYRGALARYKRHGAWCVSGGGRYGEGTVISTGLSHILGRFGVAAERAAGGGTLLCCGASRLCLCASLCARTAHSTASKHRCASSHAPQYLRCAGRRIEHSARMQGVDAYNIERTAVNNGCRTVSISRLSRIAHVESGNAPWACAGGAAASLALRIARVSGITARHCFCVLAPRFAAYAWTPRLYEQRAWRVASIISPSGDRVVVEHQAITDDGSRRKKAKADGRRWKGALPRAHQPIGSDDLRLRCVRISSRCAGVTHIARKTSGRAQDALAKRSSRTPPSF